MKGVLRAPCKVSAPKHSPHLFIALRRIRLTHCGFLQREGEKQVFHVTGAHPWPSEAAAWPFDTLRCPGGEPGVRGHNTAARAVSVQEPGWPALCRR